MLRCSYKGEWRKRVWRKQLESSGPLQQRSGVAVLKLRSFGELKVRRARRSCCIWCWV